MAHPARNDEPSNPAGQTSTRLAELRIGENGSVRRICGSDEATYRLMEMGLTPGTRVRVTGVAPLGDPLHISLRGYRLSIRRRDAEGIEVERLA